MILVLEIVEGNPVPIAAAVVGHRAVAAVEVDRLNQELEGFRYDGCCITHDLQVIVNPGGSEDRDVAVVYGLRAQMTF